MARYPIISHHRNVSAAGWFHHSRLCLDTAFTGGSPESRGVVANGKIAALLVAPSCEFPSRYVHRTSLSVADHPTQARYTRGSAPSLIGTASEEQHMAIIIPLPQQEKCVPRAGISCFQPPTYHAWICS